MDQTTHETRCPRRYTGSRPATATEPLECVDYHDHRPLYTFVTDNAADMLAQAAWGEHLRDIAALSPSERAAAIRVERLHDVDVDTIGRHVDRLALERRSARAVLFLASQAAD
ncbi:hypothetical protein [Nocardia salmonicida]|uniref:hypothetical protein n=1 Tax=Nocardia salmonicida TaxID=53431 RepID=UPI0037AD2944